MLKTGMIVFIGNNNLHCVAMILVNGKFAIFPSRFNPFKIIFSVIDVSSVTVEYVE